LAKYNNPERPADSIIKAKLEKFDVKSNSINYNRDSLSFWKKKSKLPKALSSLLPFDLTKADIISNTGQPGIFALAAMLMTS